MLKAGIQNYGELSVVIRYSMFQNLGIRNKNWARLYQNNQNLQHPCFYPHKAQWWKSRTRSCGLHTSESKKQEITSSLKRGLITRTINWLIALSFVFHVWQDFKCTQKICRIRLIELIHRYNHLKHSNKTSPLQQKSSNTNVFTPIDGYSSKRKCSTIRNILYLSLEKKISNLLDIMEPP